MSYIGNAPISAAFLVDTFSGTGSQTAFTMTVAPANTSSIIVAITGVLQDPSTYSVSGTTLTFSTAPPSGTSNISVRYLGIPASGVTTTAYRTVTNTTATAGQTSFTIPSYTVGYVDVYRNGVYLPTSDYTATTGTTVVLTNAATVGDTITTISFYVSSVLNAIQQYNGSSTNQTLTTPTLTTPTMSTATLTGTSTFAGGVANAYGFGVGTAVPSSGAGISFPAIQSASSNANTLDDYEEGSWTPTIGTASGTVTLGTTGMRYTKIGNMVSISGYLSVSSVSAPSGLTYISGFPFVPFTYPGNGSNCPYTFYASASAIGAGYIPFGYTSAGNNGAYLRLSQGNNLTELGAFFQAGMELWINCTYQAA